MMAGALPHRPGADLGLSIEPHPRVGLISWLSVWMKRPDLRVSSSDCRYQTSGRNGRSAQIPLKKSLFDCGQRSAVIH
jgi:hypothetical protein